LFSFIARRNILNLKRKEREQNKNEY